MKILIISAYPISIFAEELNIRISKPEHPYTWVTNLAAHLSLINNNEIHILTISEKIEKDVLIIKNNIFYHFLAKPPKLVHYFSLLLALKIKIKIKIKSIQPDIVHGQGSDKYGYYAVKSGFPNVLTIHGVYHDFIKSLRKQNGFKEKMINLFYEKQCFRNAKNVISISPYIKNLIENYNKNVNIFEVENPVNKIYFEDYSIQQDNVIMYVGSITPRKRFMDVLEIVKRIPECKCRVISHGILPNSYELEVKTYIKQNLLQKRIEFLGFKTEEAIFDELTKCSLLLLTSASETAPMVIAEALAMQKPVVATNTGGVKYMINNGENGFVAEVGDIDDLTEKVKFIFFNKNFQKNGIKFKEMNRSRWHPDEVAAATYEIYKNILYSVPGKSK